MLQRRWGIDVYKRQSQGSSYTEELMNDLTRKFYEYLNQAIYSEWPEERCV